MIVYRIEEKFNIPDVMAGASLGRQHIRPLLQQLESAPRLNEPAEFVVLDLSGICDATSSYLKAVVLPILKLAGMPVNEQIEMGELGGEVRNIYPLLAGLSEDVRQPGIQDMLALRGLLCLEVADWPVSVIKTARLLGGRPGVVIQTLMMLVSEGRATAASLHEKADAHINITGWNNRLADLHQLRLAHRSRQGKQWLYEPVVPEIVIQEVAIHG